MEKYSEYKDSGVEWIGEIPKHWEVPFLSQISWEHTISNNGMLNSNLLSLSYGKIIRKNIETTDGLLPTSFETYQIVEKGNVILRFTDLQNDHKSLRVGLATQDGIITSAYTCIEVQENVSPVFLYYSLHSYDIRKVFYGMGGGLRQNLNYSELKRLQMILPPLAEQTAIATYLDNITSKIDEAIVQQQKMIDLLNERKQIVISHAVTKGLNPNAPMKDSGVEWIGEIPSGWKIMKMKYSIEAHRGGIWGSEPLNDDNDVICLRVADFDTHRGLVSTNKLTYRHFEEKDIQNRILSHKSLLIEKSGGGDKSPVGRVVRYNLNERATCSNFIEQVAINNEYDRDFIYYCFKKLYSNKVNMLHLNQTTGIQNLQVSSYLEQYYCFPPLTEQEAIASYLDEKTGKIDEAIMQQQKMIALLQERKQIIINDVVTGKVKVS